MTNGEKIEIELMMQEIMADSTLPEIRRAVDDVKATAISEIKSANQKSTILSYKMLIIGALFGFLGNGFVATIIKYWNALMNDKALIQYDIILYFAFAMAFVMCIIIVIRKIGRLDNT